MSSRRFWLPALVAGVPALALAGCPGLLAGPGPGPTGSPPPSGSPAPTGSPSASVAPTGAPGEAPRRTSGLVFDDFEFNSNGDHQVLLRNLGSAAVDVKSYAVCYQAPASGLVYLRLNESLATFNTIAGGGKVVLHVGTATGSSTVGNWFVAKGDIGSFQTLGVQAAGGALALYKETASSAGFSDKTKMADYVQWGAKPESPYFREEVAVAAGLWNEGTYAKAAAPGQEMNVKIPGATGSANWEDPRAGDDD